MTNQSSQFDNILLPPVILAGLYSRSLVIIDNVTDGSKTFPFQNPDLDLSNSYPKNTTEFAESEPVYESVFSLNKLGDFNKQVLVFVSDKNSLHLPDAELELLGKMLQAIKLSLADIAIVNVANQTCNWEMIQTILPAKQVILFGVDPTSIQIPVRFPDFRIQKWNGIAFLYSPSLAQINKPSTNQVMYKKELWKALQEMFV